MTDRWGFTSPLGGVPLSEHRSVLREAERLGYTDAWTAEGDGYDAFVPLALAAALTHPLRLGPALRARGPAAMAAPAPGRFCLGLGSSPPAIVERWNGVPLRRPLARMRETLDFLRQAFAGEKVSVEGESIKARGFRLSRRPAQPPLVFVRALRGEVLGLGGRGGGGQGPGGAGDRLPQLRCDGERRGDGARPGALHDHRIPDHAGLLG